MRGLIMQTPHLSRLLSGLVALAALTFSLSLDAKTAPAAAAAPPDPNESCMMCHADPGAKSEAGKSIAVDAKVFAGSVHGQMQFKCTDCHADVSAEKLPHEPKLKPANCAGCHEAAVKDYQSTAHAKARAGGNMVAATCSDCHGNHDIRKSSDEASRTHYLKVEGTCATCHGNDAIDRRRPGCRAATSRSAFHDGIHDKAIHAKRQTAPRRRTARVATAPTRSAPRATPTAESSRENVAQMCGSCHQQVFSRFSASQHGTVRQAGNSAAPTCIDCHSVARHPGARLDASARSTSSRSAATATADF